MEKERKEDTSVSRENNEEGDEGSDNQGKGEENHQQWQKYVKPQQLHRPDSQGSTVRDLGTAQFSRRSGASGTSFSESLFSLGGCQVGKRLSREYLTPISADANSWQLCNWSFTAISGLIHVTFVKSQFLN